MFENTKTSPIRGSYERAVSHCTERQIPRETKEFQDCIIYYIDWDTQEFTREPAAGLIIATALAMFCFVYLAAKWVKRRRVKL